MAFSRRRRSSRKITRRRILRRTGRFKKVARVAKRVFKKELMKRTEIKQNFYLGNASFYMELDPLPVAGNYFNISTLAVDNLL